MKSRALLFVVLGVLLAVGVLAQVPAPVPALMNFQGRLTKPDGTPLPDTASLPLTFSLWDAPTNGNKRWEQTFPTVSVRNGVFHVLLNLGSGFTVGNDLSTAFSGTPYLQIQVGANAPLTPRQPVVSNAFAFKANLANTVPDGSITAAKFAPGANAPGGNAGGDLTGTYPNPLLALLETSLAKVSGGVMTSKSGQIGIGTTTPQQVLSIAGGLNIDQNNLFDGLLVHDGTQPALRFGSLSGEAIASKRTEGGNKWGLDFYTGTMPRVSITNNGNVGIGTTTPGDRLTVQVPTGTRPASFTDGVRVLTTFLGPAVGTDGAFFGTLSPHPLIFQAGNFVQGAILPNGNWGVGTLTPSYKLDVAGMIRSSVGGVMFPDGSVQTGAGWSLSGNSGTIAASHFLGTTDNQPLEFRVNNQRALRLETASSTIEGFTYTGINVVQGYSGNTVGPGVTQATIGGGGGTQGNVPGINSVTDLGGTIAGGGNNRIGRDGLQLGNAIFATIGGGAGNIASGVYATVAGGILNTAGTLTSTRGGSYATVGGGIVNTANGNYATVGGGANNTASGRTSTVGGGSENIASGEGATVGGGYANTASGDYSFAAGRQAKANHNGAFVWADSTTADFVSTAANQFLIRATGGVGIGTNAPIGTLHIRGNASVLNLEGSDHAYVSFFPRGVAAGRKGYFGFPGPGSNDIHLYNEAGGSVVVTGNFVNNSDARWKTNVHSLPDALTAVLSLRGVSYDWRQDIAERHFPTGRQIGFIAQEVETVLPELVHTGADGYKSVAYQNVVPVLVEAVKTLHAKVDLQKQQIEVLKAQTKRLSTLEAQLSVLTARLTVMEAEKAGRK